MTTLQEALDALPPDGKCECACGPLLCSRAECGEDCACIPCPVCHPAWFEDDEDWEPPEFTDSVCRPVELPSGETVSVLGTGELPPQGVAALGELVELVRRKHAAEHVDDEGSPELWARLAAVLDAGLSLREVARSCGLPFSTLFRVGQGRMPDPAALATLEAWLAEFEARTATIASLKGDSKEGPQ